MTFQLIGGGSDLDSTINQMNTNILELKNSEVTQFFKDDTGTRRVMLGKGANGFYGLKVSQSGTDVFSAEDDQLVFNSNNNIFKIVSTSTVSLPGPGVSGSNPSEVTVTHGLGYAPIVIAFVQTDGFSVMLPYLSVNAKGTADQGKLAYTLTCYSDNTYIYFSHEDYTQTTGGSLTIRYYVLQETAS